MDRDRALARPSVRRVATAATGLLALTVLPSCELDAFHFVVDEVTDAPDADPGDGVCEATAGAGDCTLRAAVMEANAFGAIGTLELVPGATYVLGVGAAGEDAAEEGDLDITGRVRIAGNGATIDGEAIDRVLDVHDGAELAAVGLTVTGGAVDDAGGGVRVAPGGTLHLTNIELAGNTAAQGGALAIGGASFAVGVTLAGNVATTTGGALHVPAGGAALLFNTTFSANRSAGDGGAIDSEGQLVTGYVTVTGSSSGAGGAVRNLGAWTALATLLSAQTTGADCSAAGAAPIGSYNVESATSCGLSGFGDQQSAPVTLAALGDNGGATRTQLPADGSAGVDAIPAGTPGICDAPPADQRGLARPSGGSCDVGAVELVDAPDLQVEVVLDGLAKPWDVAFAPDGTMLYSQKEDRSISALTEDGPKLLARPSDAKWLGESGMMGIAVDPEFSSNRYLYACFISDKSGPYDIRVARWRVNDDYSGVTDRVDIITGMPRRQPPLPSIGRHGGCRTRFGPDGHLWVTTGDGAIGSTPQDVQSLGGKVLRVDRDGNGVPGNNPGPPFLPQIYTYGHRNVQGIAFRPSDGAPFSIEHGSSHDDEINRLEAGANHGWDPLPLLYTEGTNPMTDLTKFPDAHVPVWASGSPTIAPSGGDFLQGSRWSGWDGALAVAVLKDAHLRVLRFDPQTDAIMSEHVALLGTYGRLRTAVQGPDGALYVLQDSSPGAILRITPQP